MSAVPFKLLLIEDNEGDARLVLLALAEHAPDEFAVTRAERLAEALVCIGRERFDIALCDLGLPDSNGLATAQAIAARAPALALVVLTGSHSDDLGREAIQHGAEDYLVKNEATGSLLARTLRYAIERKRLQAGLRVANEVLEGRVVERTTELEAAIAKLRESETRHRAVAQTAADAIVSADADGVIVGWNAAAERIFGYPESEALGQALTLLMPQRYRERHLAGVSRLKSHGERRAAGKSLELHGLTKAGSEIPIELSLSEWKTSKGLFFTGIIRDVSERKRKEEALRESEARFRTLTEMSSDFYWESDAEHRLTQRGSAYHKASLVQEFQRGLQIGKRRWEVPYLSPDEAGWQAHRAQLNAHLPFRNFELSRPGTDGTERYISTSGDPVFDDSGVFLGYRGVGSDITVRKRAEEALARESHRNQVFLRNASDGVHIIDAVGNVLEVSDSFCKMLGYPREELIGANVSLWNAQWSAQELKQHIAEQLANEGHSVFETRHRCRDGSFVDVEVTGQDLELDGKRVLFNSARDITERKLADVALRAAEERFRSLVEQSIAGTYIIQDDRLVYVNPRFAEIFGYACADELVGRESLSLVDEKERSVVLGIRRRIEGEVPSMSYSFTGLRKDGSTIDVGVHSSRATHQRRPAIIGLVQDISEKKRAEEQIQRYIAQLEGAFMRTVEVATTLSGMRDPYTAGHERRVAEIAVAIGAELGFDARRQEGLRVAGYLHDIGKITIPSEILSKPGKLSRIEFELIKGHPQASYDVLKGVEFPWPVAEVALQHHERLDGTGYPNGLKGDAILLEARILSVADVIEAMSSHRPYRPGLGIERALAEIERGRGTAYDGTVADACVKLFRDQGYAIPA